MQRRVTTVWLGALRICYGVRANKAQRLHSSIDLAQGRLDGKITKLGFQGCRDGLRPCTSWNGHGPLLMSVIGLEYDRQPWPANSMDEYYNACADSEMPCEVDADNHSDLCELLFYDKRKNGNEGLCMTADYEPLLLLKGDRLEPTVVLPNVGNFFALNVVPFSVMFWRTAHETATRHRNPFFDRF